MARNQPPFSIHRLVRIAKQLQYERALADCGVRKASAIRKSSSSGRQPSVEQKDGSTDIKRWKYVRTKSPSRDEVAAPRSASAANDDVADLRTTAFNDE